MNRYDELSWDKMLSRNPLKSINIDDYFHILCHDDETPDFLEKYYELPLLKRLKGIGLLCGTDWTRLYRNRFYYSRFDHSKGVALIVWHFTHDKAQAISGLLHDVSTPVFSHVSDFRKGDALTQTATEEPNVLMIRQDEELRRLLSQDGLSPDDVCDYHVYPVADNEIPHLSADRLEYMYPSGLALDGSWTLDEIRRTYDDLAVLKNDDGIDELGFKTVDVAELYCEKFCDIGHILQLNENKLSLHLLGQIMNRAVNCGFLNEADFMTLSEKDVIEKLEASVKGAGNGEKELRQLYYTFRTMESIKHTDEPLENHFCVNLQVKMRYINPLVKTDSDGNGKMLSEVSAKAKSVIDDFLSWHDKPWGCVPLIDL